MKIVLTGATSGIGAAAARGLHARGVDLVPVGRSPERAAALSAELGIPCHTADFTDLASVRALAATLLEAHPRIDVLAANAGGIPRGATRTGDGLAPIFQANALSPWLLTTLLTPSLRGGRVVSTSSRSHTAATLPTPLAKIAEDTTGLSPHAVYAWAKLAGALLLREFGRREPDITVTDFHPGLVASDFGRYLGGAGALLKLLATPFLDSPTTAATRLIDLATTTEDVNGHYHVDNRRAQGSPLLDDRAAATALWDLATRLTGG
ncbi:MULTISPECIES: SDR family NAD(P)-dependent oxidoreductase [Actinosynnema]|uniref:SDR family NAD(P)-dependent oxidoreductase n=1 Tax=Actinosynnema TaxID=40566 RepID=UPI0020A3ACF7|nr:SDR family NAD(P)-dependent oxidoreductase [Actinosynnema pretiosum]MCP2094485.1 Short-chain dehydrogenase [Actinosynnema pretiosum]